MTDSGGFLGVASEKATAYAAGDKDKLASVGFAAFLTDMGLPSSWFLDAPLTVTAECDVIGVRADTGSDPETFTIEDSGEMWTLCARVLPGSPDLILLVGLTSQIGAAHDHHGPALPAWAFLRMSDWLMRFKTLWKGST